MRYKKINVQLIVGADEEGAVVAQLNAALDRLEQKHTLFGGEIETVLSSTRDQGSDPHSRTRWQVGRSQLPSGLHVRA